MECSTCYGLAVRGEPFPGKNSGRGRPSMSALSNGRPRGFSNGSGRAVFISMTRRRALTGTGKQPMGPMSGRRGGGEEAGPHPTDRGKAGYKDHLLVDGQGVPLSVVTTAANVNDGPMLGPLLHQLPVVRPQPTRRHPQHLCLDAAFDNAPARHVVLVENYRGHIAPKGGRPQGMPRQPGNQARRWKVERTHAWYDQFRRLVALSLRLLWFQKDGGL